MFALSAIREIAAEKKLRPVAEGSRFMRVAVGVTVPTVSCFKCIDRFCTVFVLSMD